jgi:hypothetical protein
MMELLPFQHTVATIGWAVTDPVIDPKTIGELRDHVAPFAQSGRGGARNLLDEPNIAMFAAGPTLRRFAASVLGDSCFAVRALSSTKRQTRIGRSSGTRT